jgi:hypothetical protein
MTSDDIIRLALEASKESDYDFPNVFALERFAALVAAAEREFTVRKCLEVCEAHDTWTGRMVGDQIKYLLEDKP